MSYLLDTHTLLWWLNNDMQLSEAARKIISNSNNLIYVSSVSIWEIILKKNIGKIQINGDLEEAISNSGFEILPILMPHTIYLEKIENHHKDPFDRLLIAQALSENLTIITSDNKIALYSVPIIKT